MNDTLFRIEKWTRQASLRVQLLAVNNNSEYPNQSVRYVLLRIFEILAGKRLNTELGEYVVNEVFRVLAFDEGIEANRRLRQILLNRHRRMPKNLENAREIIEAVDALNLPSIPKEFEPPAFLAEVYRFCQQTGYLSNDDTPSP